MIEWIAADKPVAYEDALAFMDARVADIREDRAAECVWLLEHPPLYTAGTSAKAGDLLDPRFPVYKTGRGGQYTYHGPGQRVAYVMLDLKKRQKTPDIKKYVRALEQWIINTLDAFDIQGERRAGRIGIWVASPPAPLAGRGGLVEEKKIAAIGVRVRRWVTLHGIAINVDPDLSHFGGIVPCGIRGHGVTSVAEVLRRKVATEEVDAALEEKFGQTF